MKKLTVRKWENSSVKMLIWTPKKQYSEPYGKRFARRPKSFRTKSNNKGKIINFFQKKYLSKNITTGRMQILDFAEIFLVKIPSVLLKARKKPNIYIFPNNSFPAKGLVGHV